MIYNRILEEQIINISRTFPVLMLIGARQTGKTTLLQKIAKDEGINRECISFDNPMIRLSAKNDPEKFLQIHKPPLLLDEIQYVPELLPYIKIIVDKNKNMGDFWLTGSQNFSLVNNASESLAGRVGILNLYGLSNDELYGNGFGCFDTNINELINRKNRIKNIDAKKIYERILKGSYPHLYEIENVDIKTFYESYIDTYLSRDIRTLTQVADEMIFLNFLKILATRSASNLNYDEISKLVGVSSPTIKSWVSILLSSGIIFLLDPLLSNPTKKVTKAKRLYFADTGLLSFLLEYDNVKLIDEGNLSGMIFETFVVSEIYKSYVNANKKIPMYYYRDGNKKEIDLVIYQNEIATPIEIKKSTNPKNPAKNFKVLEENGLKVNNGIGLCMTSEILPINNNDYLVPITVI